MSENFGYFKLPRSLLSDPLWKGLPYTYRHIFLTILSYVVFKPTVQDDFGVLVNLMPGQFMTTERELVKLCAENDIDKSCIHRALEKFKKLGFSNQTSNHKKTIITITRKDICELIEPNFEPNSNQTRTTKEQRQERKEEEQQQLQIPKVVEPKKSDAVVAVVDFSLPSKLFEQEGNLIGEGMFETLDEESCEAKAVGCETFTQKEPIQEERSDNIGYDCLNNLKIKNLRLSEEEKKIISSKFQKHIVEDAVKRIKNQYAGDKPSHISNLFRLLETICERNQIDYEPSPSKIHEGEFDLSGIDPFILKLTEERTYES